jgi:TctA family transporter
VSATRPAILVAIVAVVAALVWGVLRLTYVSMPPLPWTALPTLLLLALGEIVTAINTRARIQRKPGTSRVEPLVVARFVALAKASAYAATVLAGVFGGFVIYLASSLDKSTPRRDFFVSVGSIVAALALVGAALFLEYTCRVPKGPDDEPDDDDRRHGAETGH